MPLESVSKDFYSRRRVKPPSSVRKIVLSTDHLGVRQIQFLDQNSVPFADGSPWYEISEVPNSCATVHVNYKGLFMRSIRIPSGRPSNMPRIWSSPYPPQIEPSNLYHTRNDCRLHYVKIDAPDVQGLLVCCRDARNVGIHAFSGTSKTFKEFVDRMTRVSSHPIYWIFFPINVDEFIQTAWIRQFKDCTGPAANPVLVIQTTRRRTVTFGPHPPAHLQHLYAYHSLVRTGDGFISGISHDGLDPASRYISEVGVTCDRRRRTKVLELDAPSLDRYEAPPIPPRGGSLATSWYYTKAPLDGLAGVQVCQDPEQSHHPCLGLLFYYKTGQVEALGQFRWDRERSDEILVPIRIENGNIDGKNYIKNVQRCAACSGSHLESDNSQGLPEYGTIVWWFGHLGDRILIYNE